MHFTLWCVHEPLAAKGRNICVLPLVQEIWSLGAQLVTLSGEALEGWPCWKKYVTRVLRALGLTLLLVCSLYFVFVFRDMHSQLPAPAAMLVAYCYTLPPWWIPLPLEPCDQMNSFFHKLLWSWCFLKVAESNTPILPIIHPSVLAGSIMFPCIDVVHVHSCCSVSPGLTSYVAKSLAVYRATMTLHLSNSGCDMRSHRSVFLQSLGGWRYPVSFLATSPSSL